MGSPKYSMCRKCRQVKESTRFPRVRSQLQDTCNKCENLRVRKELG